MPTNIKIVTRYQKASDKYLITFSWEEQTKNPEVVKKRSFQWLLNRQQLRTIADGFRLALDKPESLPEF